MPFALGDDLRGDVANGADDRAGNAVGAEACGECDLEGARCSGGDDCADLGALRSDGWIVRDPRRQGVEARRVLRCSIGWRELG